MSSRNSFSLNTTPAGSEDASPVDTLDDAFWQTHLWPTTNPDANSHPPPNVFGGGSGVSAGEDAGGFAFPLLGGAAEVVEAAEVTAVEAADPVEGDARKEGKKKEKKRSRRGTQEELASHVNGERERRKKMRTMFTTLHSFLPHLSDKVDKSTIVDEAINLIKTLETSLQNLHQNAAYKLRRHPTRASVTYEPLSTTAPKLKLAGQTTRESFLADYGSSSPEAKVPTSRTAEKSPKYDQHGRVMFQTWTSSNVVLNTFGKDEAVIMACSRKKPGLLTAIVAGLVKHKVEVEAVHAYCNGDQCSYMIHARLADEGCEKRPISTAEEVYKEAVGELMLLVADNPVKGEA